MRARLAYFDHVGHRNPPSNTSALTRALGGDYTSWMQDIPASNLRTQVALTILHSGAEKFRVLSARKIPHSENLHGSVAAGCAAVVARCSVASLGAASSCMVYRIPRSRGPLKPTERAFGSTNLPNNRSGQSSAMSQGFFGRLKRRLTSRLSLAAMSARPKCISLVTVNGQAMRLPPSLLKFSSDIQCAISR